MYYLHVLERLSLCLGKIHASVVAMPMMSLMKVMHHFVCTAILCNVDEMVFDHVCVPCPAGSTNEAGDDASLVHDTSCNGE